MGDMQAAPTRALLPVVLSLLLIHAVGVAEWLFSVSFLLYKSRLDD
jgi:hypothetical protein